MRSGEIRGVGMKEGTSFYAYRFGFLRIEGFDPDLDLDKSRVP